MFSALYTLYWPLPVAFDRIPLLGSIAFMIGAAIIMVNILLFAFNLFSTVLSKNNPGSYSFWGFLRSAFGIPRLLKWLGKEDKGAPNLDYDGLPVFLVAVGRGSIDTVINAFVLLTAGVLILVYGLAACSSSPLDPGRRQRAGVQELVLVGAGHGGRRQRADLHRRHLVPAHPHAGRPELFGANVVKTVIMVDLLVSMGVWSHHLLADRPQPLWMKLLSGQFITWGEFFTMGLTIFASLMTIWLARPVKMTPALKFILASIFGFIMGGTAGLIQANTGAEPGLSQHAVGHRPARPHLPADRRGSLVFAVLYALVPMLTKKEFRYPQAGQPAPVAGCLARCSMPTPWAWPGPGHAAAAPSTRQACPARDTWSLPWSGGVLMGVGLVIFSW
jgi:cytochrome c oxidase subunit I